MRIHQESNREESSQAGVMFRQSSTCSEGDKTPPVPIAEKTMTVATKSPTRSVSRNASKSLDALAALTASSSVDIGHLSPLRKSSSNRPPNPISSKTTQSMGSLAGGHSPKNQTPKLPSRSKGSPAKLTRKQGINNGKVKAYFSSKAQRRGSGGAVSNCSTYTPNYMSSDFDYSYAADDDGDDSGEASNTHAGREDSTARLYPHCHSSGVPRRRSLDHKYSGHYSDNSSLSKSPMSTSMDASNGEGMIENLKERFSGNPKMKPKRRQHRRSSLSSIQSSVCSQTSLTFSGLAAPSSHGYISSAGGSSLLNNNDDTDGDQDDIDHSIVLAVPPQHYKSNSTLQMANTLSFESKKKIKTEQMIESLVWFSFHIPRTVLEDLIAHELSVWKKQGISHRCLSTKRTPTRLLEEADEENDDEVSVSSLSDDGGAAEVVFGPQYTEHLLQRRRREEQMIALPKDVRRHSAILFVDMSGFTKLSTILDVESLSKVINTYFDCIVSEVISFGGDILKFAGDAFFAEWRVTEDTEDDDESSILLSASSHSRTTRSRRSKKHHPLEDLNASLASITEMAFDNDLHKDMPPASHCVMLAAKCGASIVKKFSDYHVTTTSTQSNHSSHGPSSDTTSMLNVHCGIGIGDLVGLHVGDYREGVEESVELRREFLIFGEPIDQVSKAADDAKDGQVMASPQAIQALTFCCNLTQDQFLSNKPVCIAAKDENFLEFDTDTDDDFTNVNASNESNNVMMQPYESLRMHCKTLNEEALKRLNLQMALYVHPVIRADELALSAAIQAGKISQPTETLESRHRAEAELRSVYTMFIAPQISARITGMDLVDEGLFKKLNDIMYITSRELDRYSGHLRQFIVDDKGVVLIATFGLRGSTFPNMVENNCLPATFAIKRSLMSELNVDCRIGATFGKVYCGIVGGVRRHEFACMGAPVNLAARLMGSKVNQGILVDEAVSAQCRGGRYLFKSLPPVQAKGYDKPVPILEPELLSISAAKTRRHHTVAFVGRKMEKRAIHSIAQGIIEEPEVAQSTMVFLTGDSGFGKTALAQSLLEELKAKDSENTVGIVVAQSTSTETEQRIPLSSFRKILFRVMRRRLELIGDQTDSLAGSSMSTRATSTDTRSSFRSMSRRGKLIASRSSSEEDENFGHLSTGSLFVKNKKRAKPKRASVHENLSQTIHGALGASIHTKSSEGTKSHSGGSDISKSIHNGSNQRRKRRSLKVPNPTKSNSSKFPRERLSIYSKRDDDSSEGTAGSISMYRPGTTAQLFQLLCWACEQLNYPYEYADIVGSQFLGFENATSITHVNGHVPSMEELVEFLSAVFVKIAEFTKLAGLFIDDFQWVDSFSWRILRTICKKAGNVLLICATRSHDKQALRRINSAATPDGKMQLQMIEVSLGPFDFNDIRDLIAALYLQKRSSIPKEICNDIYQRTGGLPVFVVQLLENLKRMKALHIVDGILQWKSGQQAKLPGIGSVKNGAVEETFLSRFDALDVRVRKVLQTCAVWGLSFELKDIVQVHSELDATDIESALDTAVEEMILIENEEDSGDGAASVTSHGSGESSISDGEGRHNQGEAPNVSGDRYFQFSHAVWRKNVLATMLKVRKVEIHRLIAESMESDQVLILEQSDISKLLTLFDHWKACGDFCRTAPLALVVGARLEEWELSAQSLELYQDALEMVMGGVETTDKDTVGQNGEQSDWVKVKAKPVVLDLILRLHVCAGLCYQRMNEDKESILFFEDAYNIIRTASKLSGITKSLKMPIISSLCVLKMELNAEDLADTTEDIGDLIAHFVEEARNEGNQIHIGRALAMLASYHLKNADLELALEATNELVNIYDIDENHEAMIEEYGRDFAMECVAESAQWLYLMGRLDEATQRADSVAAEFLDQSDDVDGLMYILFPVLQVLCLVGRAKTAQYLFNMHAIDPYRNDPECSEFWGDLFEPLSLLIQAIRLDESGRQMNDALIRKIELFAFGDSVSFDSELERRGWTIAGELCWRVAKALTESNQRWVDKAHEFLVPVARFDHDELFQKQAAQALLDSL